MAAVALANGLNANMLRKWVAESESNLPSPASTHDQPVTKPSPAFVPLALAAPAAPATSGDIRIEVRRGATTVSINWPCVSADACTTWLVSVQASRLDTLRGR